MTDLTTPAPGPVLATIIRHGTPKRALWHGTGDGPALVEGIPCSIERRDDRWWIECEGMRPWLIGPRTRVWLALVPEPELPEPGPVEYVRNPWSVVLLLDRPTLGAYRHLATALNAAAIAANDASVGVDRGSPHDVADMLAVRDALRTAASAALLGRLSNNPTPCRRCGAACTNCTPPPVPA